MNRLVSCLFVFVSLVSLSSLVTGSFCFVDGVLCHVGAFLDLVSAMYRDIDPARRSFRASLVSAFNAYYSPDLTH